MKFPEGRVYTIQLTRDELDWLIQGEVLWSDPLQDSPGYEAQGKIHKAHAEALQDKAVASLYASALKRNDWLEDKLREKIRALRSCEKMER